MAKTARTIATEMVYEMLNFIGENPNREGLKDTPKRVVKSWGKLYGGYRHDGKDILSPVFKEDYNQIITLSHEFFSTCEHHMLPFFGMVHIGYIPDGKVVGVSKLARLVEIFARRLQIQERLTNQIARTINDVLKPLGVAVVISAQHFCITSRGVEKQHSKMKTSAMVGVFMDKAEARAEFMELIKVQ
jgi:GTP cyclohydrolase I